jgi:ATP-binding cassette, subfamily B, bacterial
MTMAPHSLPAELHAHLWPLPRLGEGLAALAAQSGLQTSSAAAPSLPSTVAAGEPQALARWMAWAAEHLGLQAEAVHSAWPEATRLLKRAAPALIMLTTSEGPHFVLLRGARGQRVQLLGPDLQRRWCAVQAIRDLLCAPVEAPWLPSIDQVLASAQVPTSRQPQARRALLAQRLAGHHLGGVWLLRQPVTSTLWTLLAQARVPRRVLGMLGLFAALYTLEIVGWKLIGQGALDGRLDMGWIVAWVLLLMSLVPLRVLSSAINAGIALDAGRLLRQRLLAGSLRLDLDTLRRQGSGQLLARVLESQALESAGLAGALGLVVSLLELAFAGWVLLQGAAAGLQLALLAIWVALLSLLGWRYFGHLTRWTAQRLQMTEGLVERMRGHRTRLAQEHPQRRDAEEDHELLTYLDRSTALDKSLMPVVSVAPGGWILLSLLALAPALAWGAGGSGGVAGLAISLGGILFAHRALGGFSGGLAALARAAVAWQQAAPLFRAGVGSAPAVPFMPSSTVAAMGQAEPTLVDAHELAFGYRSGAAPVLRRASLQMGASDRVLLAGPSGSGKSTLAALLVGLRQPSAGLLLLGGLDRATLGEQWHRRATEAPQFHDNHIFSDTLAFNLLMGREGPADTAALAEAQALCDELGLGPLLQRMPAGLQQRVGETGWQLSHGERSRVFLARALLQRAPLTVLDESFAALDPHSLHRCLATTLRRAQALVVIAHP